MRTLDLLDGILGAAGLALRPWRWRVPAENSISLTERLAALPKSGAPVSKPVSIRWDEHQIPFIEAETDTDLAVALGVVHAHLRRGQIELLRRISQGRVAELVGPFGLMLDEPIRTVGLSRAVPDILAMMPEDSRHWLDGFVAGLNHTIAYTKALPVEMRALGMPNDPWTAADVLSVGRLAAADITWFAYMGALGAADQDFARTMWRRNIGLGPDTSHATDPASVLVRTLQDNSKLGSNCFALSGARSTSGGAIMASDPHLGATLPNLWLIAGYKSPSYHLAGFMIPGVPMAALGRNPWIAWGGTNLHAMSSDLFDVSDIPDSEIQTREVTIQVRGRSPRKLIVKETACGPIVSDLSFFPGRGKKLALRWVGHGPSDELTAMLRVNRARSWNEFRGALDGFAAPGQNMLYADAQGRVGKTIAAHLPLRPLAPPEAPIQPRANHRNWRALATGNDLPAEYDPPSGFVASANDRPGPTPVPVGFFFSTPNRIERFKSMLGGSARFSLDQVAQMQRDVTSFSMLGIRDLMLKLVDALGGNVDAKFVREALASWDGVYAEESAGALAFELMLFHLGGGMLGPRLSFYSRSWNTRAMLAEEMAGLSPDRARAVTAAAVPNVAKALAAFGTWGQMHRLRVPHPFGRLPVLGKRFLFGDWPVGGNGDTILKSGSGLTDQRHFAGLVAVSRHVSDMADLDANHFVLLGGQDGWFGSTTLIDQVPLWREGKLVHVPLRPETVREKFARETILSP